MVLRKSIKCSSLVLISLTIVAAVILIFNDYLDFKIKEIYNAHEVGRIGEIEERDKGVHLLKLDSLKNHLFLVGSSELRSWVPQNPKNMFPNSEMDANITVLGMPLVQSLHDAIRIGSVGESLKDKNVCLMISMQWFMREGGLNKNEFKSHFSALQFYEFLKNQKISENSKNYLCERIHDLLYENNIPNPFIEEYLCAKLYRKKFLFNLISPYYYLKDKFLLLKDKYNSLKLAKRYIDLPKTSEPKRINWEVEEQKAYEMGKLSCTTNEFFMSDLDWNGSVAEVIDSLKMAYRDVDLQNSKEYDDLNLLFDVCKQCGIKPYIIILSNNGFYYDFTGLESEKRNKFYDRIESTCQDFGFDYLKLSDKEYELYFIKDGMHLGWKGWLYTNKKITEYFKNRSNYE